MRIALVAFGTRGDVQPLIALGTRLSADGHEVAIGASRGFADQVRGPGLEFHTVGRDIEAILRRNAGLLVAPDLRSIRSIVYELREDIEVSFDQTFEIARGADLLVSGLHAAVPSVAEALSLPCRTLLYCPQMVRSRRHPPPGVPWFRLPGPCNEMIWSVLSHAMDLALGDVIQRHRRRHGLPPLGGMTDYLYAEKIIVASDAALGEVPADAPPGTEQTGSLWLEDEGALDPALERFLGHGEPPVCVGFGSMPDRDPAATTSLIVEALAACGRRGVILSGWTGLGEGGVPPGILVARSAPHAALLTRVAVVVHHGGAGTTAAAARAGIPQVVVPHVADQFYWGDQIWRRGLGSRPIPRPALTVANLASAIRDILSRPEVAERAGDVRARLARTHGVETVVRLLYQALDGEPERALAA